MGYMGPGYFTACISDTRLSTKLKTTRNEARPCQAYIQTWRLIRPEDIEQCTMR